MQLSILYRGPLSSCNYGCAYCPFAKRVESREELAVDRAAWDRFVAWIAARSTDGDRFGIFVTPWGEALIRTWYQDGLARLAALPHVSRVAIQTNLSCRLEWAESMPADHRAKLGLWCTYHPGWTTREKFVAQCARLSAAGVRHSVGVVGFAQHLDEARALRAALPDSTYVWVNAVKSEYGYEPGSGGDYSADQIAAWEHIDPLFRVNLPSYESRGHACNAGETAISVDGAGTMRRCHFIKAPIGNLYAPDWRTALTARTCTNDTCKCHIGYIHMPELGLADVFGDGVLERIPIPAVRLRR